MNKVKRSKKQVMVIMDGIHKIDKYMWICTVCNTEYVMRYQAQQCKHKYFDEDEHKWVSKI